MSDFSSASVVCENPTIAEAWATEAAKVLRLGKPTHRKLNNQTFEFHYAMPSGMSVYSQYGANVGYPVHLNYQSGKHPDAAAEFIEGVTTALCESGVKFDSVDYRVGVPQRLSFGWHIRGMSYGMRECSFHWTPDDSASPETQTDRRQEQAPDILLKNLILGLTTAPEVHVGKSFERQPISFEQLIVRLTRGDWSAFDLGGNWDHLGVHVCDAFQNLATRRLASVASVRIVVDRLTMWDDVSRLKPCLGLPKQTWIRHLHPQRKWSPYVRPEADPPDEVIRITLFKRENYKQGTTTLLQAMHLPGGSQRLELQQVDSLGKGRATKMMQRQLAKLDIPFEVWSGDPWCRWEN
ncbi:MAG: hypothetical protein AAGJ40_05690 [Planctomycetota bacterium]